MPQWGPTWVGDLLASPILVDERQLAMDRHKADLALKLPQPQPPDDETTALMHRMDAALARHAAANLPGASLAPGSPELPHPEQAAAEIAAQAGPPSANPAPMAPPIAPLPAPLPPKPTVGPDGLLHAPDEPVPPQTGAPITPGVV